MGREITYHDGGVAHLANKGSVFDLTTIYFTFIKNKTYTDPYQVTNLFIEALNNGYTYEMLKSDIMNAFARQSDIDFTKYKRRIENGNLLTHGVRYYHKELILMSKPPVVNHDIDNGTLTSNKIDYYLEPVASYTIDDLLNYFYSKDMVDKVEYNYKRMYGFFKHEVSVYGVEKILFMIEATHRMVEYEHKTFTIHNFDSCHSIASQYIEEVKNNAKYAGGEKYVIRKRNLPGVKKG